MRFAMTSKKEHKLVLWIFSPGPSEACDYLILILINNDLLIALRELNLLCCNNIV